MVEPVRFLASFWQRACFRNKKKKYCEIKTSGPRHQKNILCVCVYRMFWFRGWLSCVRLALCDAPDVKLEGPSLEKAKESLKTASQALGKITTECRKLLDKLPKTDEMYGDVNLAYQIE